MEKLIFLSMHLPSRKVPEAGQAICFNNLQKYIKSGKDVYLISIYNNEEEKYIDSNDYSECKEFFLFKVTNFSRLKSFILKPFLPSIVGFRYLKDVADKVEYFLRKYPDALLHIEYEQGILYIPSWHKKSCVVLHDIISQSYSRFFDLEYNLIKKNIIKFMLNSILKWEVNNLKKIQKILVLNNKDRDILLNNFQLPESTVLVDYPTISDIFYSCSKFNRRSENIMFWGAMNRFENEDAVLWFVEKIFPIILEARNDVKFYIVGANPSDKIISLQSENIIVTGFVDDPLVYFEICSISIVPLRLGAGIKIKVLEALAAEMPVVTTSVGAEGVIDKKSMLNVFDEPVEFAQGVVTIMNKADLK